MTAATRLVHRADDWVVPALVVVALVVFPFGSTNLSLRSVGSTARWPVLLAFAIWELIVLVQARRRWWQEWRPSAYHLVWVAFALLAAASATWSVTPRSSFERAVAVALFAAAPFVAVWRHAARPAGPARLATAFAIGFAVILVVSVAIGAFDPGVGRQSDLQPGKLIQRWQGVFESPNELALEALLGIPFALWIASARRGALRAVAIAAAGLALGLILLSGTRSSAALALLAIIAWAALFRPGLRLAGAVGVAVVAAVVVATAVGTGHSVAPVDLTTRSGPGEPLGTVSTVPRTTKGAPGATSTVSTTTTEGTAPPTAAERKNHTWLRAVTVKTLSGRTEAWSRAWFEIKRKPAAGWGFATEPVVINAFRLYPDIHVDRAAMAKVKTPGQPPVMVQFAGGYVEDSYIGATLQLGAIGALLLLLQLLPPVAALRRVPRVPADAMVAFGMVFAVGLLIAIVESYLWTPGNFATLPVWSAGAILLRRASIAA